MATAKKPTAPKVKSLADMFDESTGVSAADLLPEGEHKVRINEMVMKEDSSKGTGVAATYECIDGENEGKKIRQFYKLTDSEGQKAPGMDFLKRDLALMKVEATGAQLKKALAKVTEEQPLVFINVKQNGEYVNARLQGLAEGEEETAGEDVEAVELEVGNEVTAIDDGETIEGEIIKIKGDSITIKDADGAKHVIDRENVSLKTEEAEAEAEAAEIEVGSEVTWDDETEEGTVIKIKGKQAIIKQEDGVKVTQDLSDLTLKGEEVKTDEPIEVGDEVKWTDDGEEMEGLVTKINEAKGTASVKTPDKEVHVVKLNELEKQPE